jgi:hypothetical protein
MTVVENLTLKKMPPPEQQELRAMPTKSQLEAIVEQFRLDNARLAAERDAALAARDAAVAVIHNRELVRLKRAAGLTGVNLETARRWCEGGHIKSATRQASYWLCGVDELGAFAAQRMPPADQQRNLSGRS